MLIYFSCSSVIGLIMFLMSYYSENSFDPIIFVLLIVVNAIINLIFILFQATMIYVFPENRQEFLKSIIILFFNFPFIVIYWILIILSIQKILPSNFEIQSKI